MAFSQTLFLHEFKIKETRYANYCYAVVGETAISLPILSCKKAWHFILNSCHSYAMLSPHTVFFKHKTLVFSRIITTEN